MNTISKDIFRSIHEGKWLYEVMFDVTKRSLLAGNKIKICTEFCVDGTTKQSIQNFIQPEEIGFLEDIDQIPEFIKDSITENIHGNKNYSVDDCPYFLKILQLNLLEKELLEVFREVWKHHNIRTLEMLSPPLLAKAIAL